MKFKDSFHPYAMITIVFWSLAYVLTRMTLHYFSAFSLGFLRYFAASCALVIVVLFTKMKPPKKADILWFLAAGAVGFFLYMIAFNKGCETVSSSTGSVIIATVPVMTALLARFFYQEKLSTLKWAAICVEFSGVLLLAWLNGGVTINAGILWLLLAAVALSSYNILQRKLTKTYSSLQTASFSIFAGTLMLAVFLPGAVRQVQAAPPMQIVYVVLLGVFSSAVAYVAWSKAFAKATKTSSVSNYMFITPFLTSLLGFLLAGETPDIPTVIGGAVILFGVFLFNFSDKLSARFQRSQRI